MMHEGELSGIFVPVVTPFSVGGDLDLESYRRYIGELLEQPVQGLVINGTTGEAPTVSWEEVTLLVEVTRSVIGARRVPIVIGTGTNDTASTVKRTELAGKLGADAALVVVPYYNRPAQAGIVEHFRQAAQVGVPVIAYEIPVRTGVAMTIDTARTIMELNGVIGLKDSSGGTELVSALRRFGSKPVLCGDDLLFCAMLEVGAAGGMLASANLRTGTFVDVFRLAQVGRRLEAREAFDKLLPLIRLLFRESNPAPLKWALARSGLIASNTVRLPLSPITHELRAELEAVLFS